MSEVKIKPRISSSTMLKYEPNGTPYFEREMITQEWSKDYNGYLETSRKKSRVTPEEMGFRKEFDVTFLLTKKVPSRETFEGEDLLFFEQHVSIRVRPDQKNIWLLKDRKVIVHIRSLAKGGISCRCPLNTNNNIVVTKSKPKKISIEEARKLVRQTGYGFSKVLETPSGQEYGIAV